MLIHPSPKVLMAVYKLHLVIQNLFFKTPYKSGTIYESPIGIQTNLEEKPSLQSCIYTTHELKPLKDIHNDKKGLQWD